MNLKQGTYYKYLHDSPPSKVIYLKEGSGTANNKDYIFVDKKGEWILIKDSELEESISELSGEKIEVEQKPKERSLMDVIYCRK